MEIQGDVAPCHRDPANKLLMGSLLLAQPGCGQRRHQHFAFGIEDEGECSISRETSLIETQQRVLAWDRVGGAGTHPKHPGLLGGTCPLLQHPEGSPIMQADVLMEKSCVSCSTCVIDLVLQDRYLSRGLMYQYAGREREGRGRRAPWVA